MRRFGQMKLIGIEKLVEFWEAKRDAENALRVWIQNVRQAVWKNPAETHLTYRHADLVGSCTVFNVRGNNYRLIVLINYEREVVEVLHILTHKEYDRNKWKKDCNC